MTAHDRAVTDRPYSLLTYQMLSIPVIVLTKIFREVLIRMPIDVMSTAPDPRIRLGIIDGRFILQRVVIRTRDTFDQMKSIGMRHAEPRHPEFFVEADGVDHQRIALPMTDRVSKESRV